MRVPVLCYHRIETPPAGFASDSNYVTPLAFRAHVAMLAGIGCTGVTVTDIARWQQGEITLPQHPVAITFDDAYTSVADGALPVLDEYGWPCTIFAVTSQLGGTNAWDTDAPPARLMDTETLAALAAAGHEIGSHTRNHRRIKGLCDADAMEELAGSRQELEDALARPVTSFAFPYGSHDRTALAHVQAAGYRAACTLKRWANPSTADGFRLGRMSVGGPLSAWQLGAKLAKLMVTPSRRA